MALTLENKETNNVQVMTKKIKNEPQLNNASKLYQPFKAVGYICNEVPFSIQTLGEFSVIGTVVGNTFHLYDLKKLVVVLVGRQCEKPINAIALRREHTFVAVGNQILKYKRTHQTRVMKSPTEGDIFLLQIFGAHIMALTEDNCFQLWDIKNGELYTCIDFDSNSFRVTSILHPDTYLNKVIFGSTQGSMELWNIKTRKLIYKFKSFNSPITCLAQSPIVDVIAIGLLDGRIILYNIKLDKKLFSFQQEGKVTCISFRTDSFHHMATSSMDGDIAIWDLEEKRLFHVMKYAHNGNIPSIQFMNGQPLLISSGSDNTLKQWLFDTHDDLPRLYKSRSGHFEPPTQIIYNTNNTILSASQDLTLRQFSTFKENQSCELSQGKLQAKAKSINKDINSLKLPPITQFTLNNQQQQKRWDNILSIHLGQPMVRTWSLQKNTLGEHILLPPNNEIAKSVAISHCNNFGLIGTIQGYVHQFNLQSGLLRKSTKDSHEASITCILTDNYNRLFSTVSLDGVIKIWEFKSLTLLHSIDLKSSISYAISHKENSLIATACDDFSIKVVDIETQKVVRIFNGHQHRITGMAFSPDGRWLVSSSLDSTIRTWDIPTGSMIDIFVVPNVVTCLNFSPQGDFLATTHAGQVGIFLWSNKSMYTDVNLKSIPISFIPNSVELPQSLIEEKQNENEELMEDKVEDDKENELEDGNLYRSPDQLTSEMITLSNQPWSKWQKLLNLETIKQRNKPIEPIKQPELAPFFLTTTQGVNPQFIINEENKENNQEESKVTTFDTNIESEFIKLMREAVQNQEIERLIQGMEIMSPPQIEVEMNLLSVSNKFNQFKVFLKAIILLLNKKVGFEMAHAYLNTFLRVHGDLVNENPLEFNTIMHQLKQVIKEQWSGLADTFRFNKLMVNFVRNARV
ncbi:WD40 repeat-like protein [Neoconidiobolus thromboides FSU 785]|nr:WD40 repeat-like protein [Neoconidiobolus thromboides FSU 785]